MKAVDSREKFIFAFAPTSKTLAGEINWIKNEQNTSVKAWHDFNWTECLFLWFNKNEIKIN